MKKFLAVLLVALCGAAPLFAGDAEEIKSLLIKDLELGANGDFTETLALRTPDFVEITDFGTFTIEHFRWMILSLDGKHPEEFMLLSAAAGNRGVLTPEMRARIREASRDPKALREYAEIVPGLLANIKADCALQLKTFKIIDIKINGDSATTAVEYDAKTPDGIKHCSGTISLRRVDGKWMICKVVYACK